MQLLKALAVSAPFVSTALARQFDIPTVDHAVQQALSEKGSYQAYEGPVATSNATNTSSTSHPPLRIDVADTSSYWLENVQHQGVAPCAQAGYTVFRNVKTYGAVGDGSTDDTAAIQAAINDGNRCGKGCSSSTVTPALVYFPAGTYLISSPIDDQYYTQLIGDADTLPTIKASSGFQGGYMIDSDPYYTSNLNWVSTNVFFRQIRNLQFDTTAFPAASSLAAIHWPTAQATSIQNCIFNLNSQSGTVHQGIFTESGSAGFVGDLTFNGGAIGWSTGNQQYTARNLTFNGCQTAISHYWDWSYTYSGLTINNCPTGIDISAGGSSSQEVGSITVLDSTFSGVGTAIKTSWTTGSSPATAGSVILENVVLNSVTTAVENNGGVALGGGSSTIAAWGQGHQYSGSSQSQWSGTFTPNTRPSVLTQGGSNYYARSKPSYNNVDASGFLSARSSGAQGDGNTDDTAALQGAINSAASQGKILLLDAGYYVVTDTITIPAGSKIVGEAYPVIISSGGNFNDINNPRPVIKVGNSGDQGQIEWSDTIVSTRGAQAGATLIEYNLASGTPSGIWDVHARVGGFQGSDLQLSQCPTTSAANDANCIGAYMLMHITSSASGLFMENNWFWTADHDADSSNNTQITIYSGRGMLVESTGPLWLSGSAVEHNVFYQYQFNNAQNVFAGFIQTETPYYMPAPTAPGPFPVNSGLNDPNFASSCPNGGTCAEAWGFRAVNSQDIYVYGAGFYSFFNDYSTTCSDQGGDEHCQDSIVDIESSSVSFYNLNTVGAQNQLVNNGATQAVYSDNVNVFPDTIALIRT